VRGESAPRTGSIRAASAEPVADSYAIAIPVSVRIPNRIPIRAPIAEPLAAATLVGVRPNKTGVIASVLYLATGLIWLLVSGPPGSWWLLAWFVALAVFGSFIPGEANQVSLARAYLAGPAAAYSVSSGFGPLAVVVAVAALTDLVDGTVARRFEHPSNLGGAIDPVVDGVFMGAVTAGLAVGGAIPVWLALVVIARYLLPAAAGAVLLAFGRRLELRHTVTGQISTTLILVLIGGVCLFRALSQDPDGYLTAAEVVIPVATVATWVHLALTLRRPVRPAGPG
jgi:cardiolipin synthase